MKKTKSTVGSTQSAKPLLPGWLHLKSPTSIWSTVLLDRDVELVCRHVLVVFWILLLTSASIRYGLKRSRVKTCRAKFKCNVLCMFTRYLWSDHILIYNNSILLMTLFNREVGCGLYYIVLYCIVLYYIVLYCIVLYCIVLYCIVLYCIVLYFRGNM